MKNKTSTKRKTATKNMACNLVLADVKITVRDYFAGLAMQAQISRKDLRGDTDEDVALNAYEYADAMMRVRE